MRIIEAIFQSYLDEIENKPYEENDNIDINLTEKDKELIDMFKKPAIVPKQDRITVDKGSIYLTFKNHIPIYYVVYEVFEEGIFEVLKATTWIELTNHEDYIISVNGETLAIEIWNNFYLKEDDIKNSVFIGKILEEDMEIIKSYKSGLLEELPLEKRGVYSVNPTSYQQLFHKKESEIVREYKFFIFEEDENWDNVISVDTTKHDDIKFALAASVEKTTARGDAFVLEKDVENKLIVMHILEEELLNKSVVLRILGEDYKIEELPDTIYIQPSDDVENIDLEEFAKKISIEVIQ
ncbi:MAG TPA: hypothetical protein ENO33_03045 [Hydrogenobaculum sp.]|nr:hypothetical protein [Hydrogenobaculum sp.]